MSISKAASGKVFAQSIIEKRLQIEHYLAPAALSPNQLGTVAMCRGITQSPNPSPLVTADDRGSELFEQICGYQSIINATETATGVYREIARITGPVNW